MSYIAVNYIHTLPIKCLTNNEQKMQKTHTQKKASQRTVNNLFTSNRDIVVFI